MYIFFIKTAFIFNYAIIGRKAYLLILDRISVKGQMRGLIMVALFHPVWDLEKNPQTLMTEHAVWCGGLVRV